MLQCTRAWIKKNSDQVYAYKFTFKEYELSVLHKKVLL